MACAQVLRPAVQVRRDSLGKTVFRRRESATRAIFLVAGYGRASWAPLVPFVKDRVGLDDAQLGLLLVCLGAGSILAMPFAGAWTARFGCRKVIVASCLFLCVSLACLPFAHNVLFTACALSVFGMAAGTVDVAMNIQAIDVEREYGRSIMSGFHAFYSVGGIVGAAGPSLLLTMGLSAATSTAFAAALMIIALAYSYSSLAEKMQSSEKTLLAVPRGIVIVLSILTFIVFLAESAVLDWSGVFITSERSMNPSYAGLGYAAFATTMTVGRLVGDRMVRHVGAGRIAIIGSLGAASGFVLVALVPSWQVALLGYALVGAGCSNIAPVLFSALGRQKVMSTSAAVSAMTTIGYGGIFAGPVLIGAIARWSALPTAFLATGALLVLIATSAQFVLREA